MHPCHITIPHPRLCKELAVRHSLDFSLGDIAKDAQPRSPIPPNPQPMKAQNKLSRGCSFLCEGSSEVARLKLFSREMQETSLQLNEAMSVGVQAMPGRLETCAPSTRGIALGRTACRLLALHSARPTAGLHLWAPLSLSFAQGVFNGT